jgi:RHS repeat-associated protein
VQQSVTSDGTTTTTSYIGTYQDVITTGSTTVTTKYYSAGPVQVVNKGGSLSYLGQDGLQSVSIALDINGMIVATSLYAPYGETRYSDGTMPTSYGYTHQRQDPSGLDYYHARYYNSSVGQFTSVDDIEGRIGMDM